MAERFDILYRFSTDNGATWTDVSEQVNSLQTNITQNLCTNNFISAKDEATFVLPETPLYYPDNTPTPKKQLIDAILGNDPVLVHINERKPSKKVMWDDNDVLWKGKHVVWSWSTRRFTGYVDKSSVSLRSYPLPPNLTVRLQDVSVLHLDDKVDRDVCLEDDPDGTRLHISDIVSALLGYAGYTDIGSLALDAGDDVIIQAFVIDKDKAKTYRQYIDTLLFEAGGYVLDFNEYGQANVVHLKWDGSVGADRTIDNPMNANGVTMRSAYLVNDGAKVKWSTLEWGQNKRLWISNTSPKYEDGVMVGEIVHDKGYWPPDGDVSPVYFQYDAKLLDTEYIQRQTRWANEDLSIIMAKNTRLGVDTLKGTTPFPIEDWDKHDPNSWPVGDTWHDKYGLDSNPQYWPTKMWILLQNKTGEDLNVSLAYIYGDVLYRSRINTMQTDGSKNPKEYVSEYIYDKDQAERFLQFYWHFLQTSRYQFSWSEPNVFDALNSVVSVGIKGNSSMQKSLVVGKSSQWLNASTEIVTYVSVGIDAYVPSQLIPTIIAPSSTNNAVPSTKSAVTATFSTAPTLTLAQWEDLETAQQEWTVTNPSSFSAGDVAVINGYISDMDDTPIKLYMNVDSITGSVISGAGIRIEYTPIQYQWDFSMSATEAIRQDRDTVNGIYTDIVCESMELGYGLLPYWKILNGDPSLVYFANNHSQLNSGDKVTVRIWAQNTEDKIVIRMASDSTPSPVYSIEKAIAIKNVTEYNHDFGAWEPTGGFLLPDHITVGGVDYDILQGDFFVAKVTFATASSGTVTAVGTENPRNLGWMERLGSGTSADPYYYVLTSDTSCSVGDSYYTANSGDTYVEGVPYGYVYPAWHNEISATTENAGRMLSCLANVLNEGGIQPSTKALFGWFKNLTALNAVIQNLTARNVTVSNDDTNPTFQFRAHAYDADGNRLQYPIFDIIFNGETIFSVSSQYGLTNMKNASIEGDFTSTGFATSKASDSPITISSVSSNSLTRYYSLQSWINDVETYLSFVSYNSSFTLTSITRNSVITAGMPSNWGLSVGQEVLVYNISGTFKGSSFTSINIDGTRSMSMSSVGYGVVLNNVLWIGQVEYGSLSNIPELETPFSQVSTVTINAPSPYGTVTIVYTDYELGYYLTTAFLQNVITTYSIPTSTNLQITSGTVTLNGTSMTPSASNKIYINISTSTLRIYNTDANDDIQSDQTFYAENYYSANAFAFSSAVIASSLSGIKTMHIVPYGGGLYEIGQETNKYKKIYAEKVYGAVFN